MAAPNTAWGIDIGQCALKAVKIRRTEDQMMVEAFEVIEHSSLLSQPDVDAEIVIHQTLDELLQRVDLSESSVSVSVLGQSSFTRFVELPPVEPKKVPDVVRFEAEQQIPFPIDEVIWRYQLFHDPDNPKPLCGLFAMKQADVAEMLSHFVQAGLEVDVVQMAPLALYNFMVYDGQLASDGATLMADVGADKTHLVIADGPRLWTRTIQIGGNNFTEALVKSFKLSFPKAEKLKRAAASSKYARQIFQVMRPVFADLVQEIQRSIGYYTSINRDTRFRQMLGMGNGFRLPGMHKYLEQNLNMQVSRLEQFNQLGTTPEHFNDFVLSLGVAYGLAVQALDEGQITTNLLPEALVRKRLWGKKKPWFAFAAASLVLAAGLYTFRTYNDQASLEAATAQRAYNEARSILSRLESYRNQSRQIISSVEAEEEQIQQNLSLRDYTPIWPAINSRITEAVMETMIPENDRQILQAFDRAGPAQRENLVGQIRSDQTRMELIARLPYQPPAEEGEQTLRQKLIEQLGRKSRDNRNLLIMEKLESSYRRNVLPGAGEEKPRSGQMPPGGGFGVGGGQPSPRDEDPTQRREGFVIELSLRTPLSQTMAVQRRGELAQMLKNVFQTDTLFEVIGDVEVVQMDRAETRSPDRSPVVRRGMPDAIPGPEIRRGRSETDEQEPTVDPQWRDPLFPDESIQRDVTFTLTLRLAVLDDGVLLPGEREDTNAENPAGRRGR